MVTSSNGVSGWDYGAMALGLYHSDYYLKASHFNPVTKLEKRYVSMDFETSALKKDEDDKEYFHLNSITKIGESYYGVYKILDQHKMIQLTEEAANKIKTLASSQKNQLTEIRCYLKGGNVKKIIFLAHEENGQFVPKPAFAVDKNNGDIQIKMGATDDLNKGEIIKRHALLALSFIPHIALSALNVLGLTLKLATFANFWMHQVVQINKTTNKPELKTEFGIRNGFYDTWHDISRIVLTPLFLVALTFAPVIGLVGAPMAGRKIYATSERFLYHQSVFAGCFQPNHQGYSRIGQGPFIIPFKNENDTKEVDAKPLQYENVKIELTTKAGTQDITFECVPYAFTENGNADQLNILIHNKDAITQLIDKIHNGTLALLFTNVNTQFQIFYDFKLHNVVAQSGTKNKVIKNLILRVTITTEQHNLRTPPQDSHNQYYRNNISKDGKTPPRTIYSLQIMAEK